MSTSFSFFFFFKTCKLFKENILVINNAFSFTSHVAKTNAICRTQGVPTYSITGNVKTLTLKFYFFFFFIVFVER